MLVDIYYITFPKLQAVRSWGDHPLLKRSAMNQNEFAKGDRDKGIPSVKGESYYIYIYIIWTRHFILFQNLEQHLHHAVLCMAMSV